MWTALVVICGPVLYSRGRIWPKVYDVLYMYDVYVYTMRCTKHGLGDTAAYAATAAETNGQIDTRMPTCSACIEREQGESFTPDRKRGKAARSLGK